MKLRLLALFFALIMLFSLAACANNNTDPAQTTVTNADKNPQTPTKTDVRISVFKGTTGFGMAKLMEDAAAGSFASENYSFDVMDTDVTKAMNAINTGEIDIAALPTNAASLIYNKTQGKVKILAVNTLGCLFLVNTGSEKITSLSDLSGKTVYAPAQNPTFIFTYLCQQSGLTVIKEGTPTAGQVLIDSTSYAAADNLKDVVASGTVTLAVLPEPMVTIATSAGKKNDPVVNVSVDLDLTAEWDKLPEKQNSLVQGCVVVRTAFLEQNPTTVANFLTAYKASIEYTNANPAEAAKLIVKHGIFANENVAKAAIPKCNIAYVDGEGMKTAVSTYLEILNGVNANSIGGKLPEAAFYYIAQ